MASLGVASESLGSQEFQGNVGEFTTRAFASSHPGWFAVFTMARHEKRVVTHCAERGLETFLPLYRVRHKWKNRCTATVDLPLFPNYLFVRIEAQDRTQVLKLPGVLSIVSSGRHPLAVPDEYITSLRQGLLTHRIEPHPNVEAGDRVWINTGPLAGMEGFVDRQKNELRVVLRLEMIGRSMVVEVGAEEISLVSAAANRTALSWCGSIGSRSAIEHATVPA